MKRTIAMTVLLSLAAAGCDGVNYGPDDWQDAPPASPSRQPDIDRPSGAARTSAPQPAPAASGGDQYTVLLYIVRTDDHIERVKGIKEMTERDTGWSDLYILHDEGHSQLYWGRYPSIEAAQNNLKKAKEYITRAGVPAFATATVVPIPGYEPGPPEWNLENAPGAYTVVVAVFYDVPEAGYVGRKEFAVAYCRQLRQEGEDAYYHHGVTRSSVSIGSFPASAVRMVTTDGKTRPVISDPRVDAIRQRYEYLAVNGYSQRQTVFNSRTGQVEWQYARPELYKIPDR